MEIKQSEEKLKSLDEKYEREAVQCMFFRDIKEYISDLCDCLAQKAPLIEEYEEELYELELQHADMLQRKYESGELWTQEYVDPKYKEKKGS